MLIFGTWCPHIGREGSRCRVSRFTGLGSPGAEEAEWADKHTAFNRPRSGSKTPAGVFERGEKVGLGIARDGQVLDGSVVIRWARNSARASSACSGSLTRRHFRRDPRRAASS
jgi:hypothetical protein